MLVVLASFEKPAQVKELQEKALSFGFREPKKWNISDIFGRSNGLAIRVKSGWQLSEEGKARVREIVPTKISPSVHQVAVDLRKHLDGLMDQRTKAFLEEAIKCHEFGLFRSAIVMSWLAAMDALHRYVHSHHLAEFNAEATRIFGKKWKAAVSQDDLGKMTERDFLERIEGISLIGKNAKTQLISALDLRNGCGHPNSLKVGPNKSAAHIETLLQNVFDKF